MSTICQKARLKEGRCSRCDHDLTTKPDLDRDRQHGKLEMAHIYCTNDRCTYAKVPHPTKMKCNRGFAKA